MMVDWHDDWLGLIKNYHWGYMKIFFICINHYICWITNTMRTLFTYFNTPPYSCIYKLCNTVAVQCRQFTSRLLVLLNLLYTRGERSLCGLQNSFFFVNWPLSSTLTLHYMGGRNLPPLGFWTLEPSILIWGGPDFGTIYIYSYNVSSECSGPKGCPRKKLECDFWGRGSNPKFKLQKQKFERHTE